MTDSEYIMHAIFILLKGCSRGYATDENSKQVCRTHAKLLPNIYCVFSLLWKYGPTRDSIGELGDFFAASVETWYKILLSVTPKVHVFEYHAVESMQYLHDICDNIKDFIKLYH